MAVSPSELRLSQCLIIRPTRQEFCQPFTSFVEGVLARHPGIPCFKVIPPKGWSARSSSLPKLDDVLIGTPIKQHVFGTKGAYRCVLEEQETMSVTEFKRLAYDADHQPPKQRHREDTLMERAFWSGVTSKAPLYGADTPESFFDADIGWGWNLRKLGCLLCQTRIPRIPGVNSPMTYFGMWKSFFSWHVEDMDLYSINYLHYGAPKVWYCVKPADRTRFEAMCKALFPELARNCKAFMRHKDVLLSPRLLRSFNIELITVKQEVGEFMVLNAGAFHSGYNQGYNCAEAVNFALADWVALGRRATRCMCSALDDAVSLDVRLFKPEGESWTSDEEDDSSEASDFEISASDSETSSQTAAKRGSAARNRRRGPPLLRGPPEGATLPGRKRKAGDLGTPESSPASATPPKPRLSVNGKRLGRPPQSRIPVEAEGTSRGQIVRGTPRKGTPVKRSGPLGSEILRSAAKMATSGRNVPSHANKAGSERKFEALQGEEDSGWGSGADEADHGHVSSKAARVTKMLTRPGGQKRGRGAASGAGSSSRDKLRRSSSEPASSEGDDSSDEDVVKPKVIVGEDERGKKFFYLVMVEQRASKPGMVMLRWLEEHRDGLFRPSEGLYLEDEKALIDVRTQWMKARGKHPGGHKLLTMRSRILDTELVD